MEERTKKNLKRAAAVTGAAAGAAFLIMRRTAKKQYPKSVYADKPEEQNPMQDRMVEFVETDTDPVNADGKQGHLEAVANTAHIHTFYEQYAKRFFDVVFSFCGLVVLSPVYVVTALAIKADDPGPVLFKQKRVGTDKSYFELLKFRSMSVNTPKDVPTHMLQNSGITKVGSFIRKASIDELPQLWNIFRGNMSVIGPRPALWNQDYLTAARDKYGANDVKPGLTGLAQISGRDKLGLDDKARLDGIYAEELKKSSLAGFIMDIKMILGSVQATLESRGVVEGGTGTLQESSKDITFTPDLVSIITPAYNAGKYISDAVESVLHQTYKNWELIIVDDCSTDDTFEIASRFAENDSRIKVFRNKKNSGVAATRNAALEKAKGEFIAFLDADDLWLPHKLEKQTAFMKDGHYAVTYTNYQRFDSKTGQVFSRIMRAPSVMTVNRIYGDTSIGCLTVMVNRGMVGNFRMPSISHTEDNITWQKILARGFLAYRLDDILSLYRKGNQSLTNSKKKAAMQQWETYRKYYGFSVPRSAYYFTSYAFHAVKKHFG